MRTCQQQTTSIVLLSLKNKTQNLLIILIKLYFSLLSYLINLIKIILL